MYKASPLELFIGKVARPLSIMCSELEIDVDDIDEIREKVSENIMKCAAYDKSHFDKTKAKIKKIKNKNRLGSDFLLLKNEERNQTKLDPKFKGHMFESHEFVKWINDLGCNLHYITPEMHQANGQAERYMCTVLNMLRIEANYKNASWSDTLWKLQLVLNITKQKVTRTSPLTLLIGTEATTPIVRALVRDLAVEGTAPNREALREITRDRTRRLLRSNQINQDERANQQRRPPRLFNLDDCVFVIKFSQSTGKLDSGMRGPYKVTGILPGGRYSLRLLSESYGKTTQAAAQHMVPWRGEWCPETCAAFFENEAEDISNETVPQASLSMPLLDDNEAGPSATNETSTSGTSRDHCVEDDSESGEAV